VHAEWMAAEALSHVEGAMPLTAEIMNHAVEEASKLGSRLSEMRNEARSLTRGITDGADLGTAPREANFATRGGKRSPDLSNQFISL
jgi:hypothetical protein